MDSWTMSGFFLKLKVALNQRQTRIDYRMCTLIRLYSWVAAIVVWTNRIPFFCISKNSVRIFGDTNTAVWWWRLPTFLSLSSSSSQAMLPTWIRVFRFRQLGSALRVSVKRESRHWFRHRHLSIESFMRVCIHVCVCCVRMYSALRHRTIFHAAYTYDQQHELK